MNPLVEESKAFLKVWEGFGEGVVGKKEMIECIRRLVPAIEDAERSAEEAKCQLGSVDGVLARRDRLDDKPDRIAKIQFAINCAAKGERLQNRLHALLPELRALDEAGKRLRDAAVDEIHPHYDESKALSDAIDGWDAARAVVAKLIKGIEGEG